MNNAINKKLFEDIEKKIVEESGKSLWGRSHPVNVLINLQDDIIPAYELWVKLQNKKYDAEKTLEKINEILGVKN